MSTSFPQILLIDLEADGRWLLGRTLMRVLPRTTVVETEEYQAALDLVQAGSFIAIVVHRVIGGEVLTLVQLLRKTRERVPILAIAGADRAQELIAAGATQCLSFAEWLRVGTVVAELIVVAGRAQLDSAS